MLQLEGMEQTPWAMAMATALVTADHEYPQTAVLVTAPGTNGEVMCVARGDMEHYAPDYMNTTRTFPLVDTGKTTPTAAGLKAPESTLTEGTAAVIRKMTRDTSYLSEPDVRD